jgi:diguanylate cyclase (GGDEF)-like protein
MNQNIVVVGSNDANCQRIKETLRRRFRNASVSVDDSRRGSSNTEIYVIAQGFEAASESPVKENPVASLEERTRRAEFLFETTRILSSSHSLPEMLNQAVARSQEVLGETAMLILLEPTPRLQSVVSKNHEQVLQLLTFIINSRPSELETALQKLLTGDEPLFIPDLGVEGELPHSITVLARQLQFRSMIATVIKSDSRNFGVFITASSKTNDFTPGQQSLSREFCQAIGTALEKVETIRQLEERANRDSLTGLYNTRFFSEAIVREIARAERQHSPLSLLLIDIDDFKKINDTQGHASGNDVLRNVSRIFQRAVRITDVLVRIGGDEFGVLLPGTDLAGAMHVAENIRSRVETYEGPQVSGSKAGPTVSIGLAQYLRGSGADVLQVQADQALYRAKELSKNRVEVFDPNTFRQAGS